MVELLLGKLLILLCFDTWRRKNVSSLVNFDYWVFGICVIEVNLFSFYNAKR